TMTTGMGAREQPLTLIITTAGFDIQSPCYDKRSQVTEILEGIRTGGANDQIFGIIYTIDKEDDWKAPEAVIKSNPNCGVSVKYDYLLAKQELGITTPRQTNQIKTKHFNIWVTAKSAFYNMDHWRKAEDKSLKIE
ncbi:terminase TerL endonuclease subunit, partial [Providencia huaxiensis]